MSNRSEKIWIGFGIITVISGVGLMFANQYLLGIAGSIVGAWLILQNIKQINNKN